MPRASRSGALLPGATGWGGVSWAMAALAVKRAAATKNAFMKSSLILPSGRRARSGWARRVEEMAQQPELGRAERDGGAAAPHLVAGHVHLDVGIAELLADQGRAHPAQHRHGARDQLAGREGLGHIIVGAGLEAADPVA